jgi:two-component system, cell cycle sensor histidine kinase and response regulator CckA
MSRVVFVATRAEELDPELQAEHADSVADAHLAGCEVVVVADLAILAELRATESPPPVLVRTSDDAMALRAIELGAADFIPMTAGTHDLALRIRGVQRRQTEDRAHALALFPELSPTAVVRISADGRMAFANTAATELARAFAARIEELLPSDMHDIARGVLATARPSSVIETQHGTRTLAWTFHPVALLHAVHGYAVDITEQLLVEEHLRQSQKMDAIGHLASGIAHDFNNLLTVIGANTALLQRTNPAESLTSIATATDRAAGLVRQLLAFSRQQVLQTRDLEINGTVVNLLKMLELVVRQSIEVSLDLADHPIWARADASMLDQVLMNLVVNARDAMPGGGKLTISTSVLVLDEEDRRAMPDLEPGAYARIRVLDTGMGIPPELLPKVFDPFFTTKEVGKGTGLGLATVFGIVKQHAGAIAVTSEIGRGTTFSLLLPAARETVHYVEQPVEIAAAEPERGTESVVVVEDEPAVRSLMKDILEANGYRVRALGSGVEALAWIERSTETFDLLLTDMAMPGGVSGRDLAAHVQSVRPAVRVLYASGFMDDAVIREARLEAGVSFLQKPFTPVTLLACVRACLDATSSRR